MVNLARKAGVQPGPALDRANRKFRERFEAVEALCAERGIDLDSAGLEVLDGLWEEVKSGGKGDALICHPEQSYGYNRWICLGNAIASRMCGMPQIQATVRSTPSPKPECTNVP